MRAPGRAAHDAVSFARGLHPASRAMPAALRLPLFDLDPPSQRTWLIERLARPAPESARGLSDGFRFPGREAMAIPAAVLVPVVNRPDGLQLLLTQRSADLPDHPGQISFPGGRLDPGDADHAAAALRETAEEIGLAPAKVDVLGELSSYDTVSGYRVRPVHFSPVFRANVWMFPGNRKKHNQKEAVNPSVRSTCHGISFKGIHAR